MKKIVNRYGKFNIAVFTFTTLLMISSLISIAIVDTDAQRSRMIFVSFLSFVMDLIIVVPPLITEKIRLALPKTIETAYILFAFAAIILGDCANFYDKISFWDSILHTFSGLLLGALGFILINTLNNRDDTNILLSPLFVCCVSVCFAVTMGAIWELCEFTFDGLFGFNSQQYMESTRGTIPTADDIPLQGHDALADTMKDLFLDLLGALIMAVIGFFEIKHNKKNSIVRYKIARIKQETADELKNKENIDNNATLEKVPELEEAVINDEKDCN